MGFLFQLNLLTGKTSHSHILFITFLKGLVDNMKVLGFLKIDMRRTKAQLLCMILFAFLATLFSFMAKNIYAGAAYLLFAAILMQGAAFTYEKKTETGFDNLLPATTVQRVAGRYALGMLLIMISVVSEVIVAVGLNVKSGISIKHLPETIIILISIGMIAIAVQSVVFYAAGRGNSEQLMSIVHMLPGLVLYIFMAVIMAVVKAMQEGEVEMLRIVEFILEHSSIVIGVIFVVGVISYIGGIYISAKFVDQKDFA